MKFTTALVVVAAASSHAGNVTLAMLQAWGKGEDLSRHFTSDCVIDAKSNTFGLVSESDDYKVYHGHSGLKQWLNYLDTLTFDDFTPTNIASSGNTAYVTNEYKMSMNGKMPMDDNSFRDVMVTSVKDGKISNIKFSWGNPRKINEVLKAGQASYSAAEKDEARKWVESKGFPWLAAFDAMTPKLTKTFLTNYIATLSPGALQHLSAGDLEVIYAATSAANNCELCLSFHAITMLKAGASQADVDAIVAGGLPQDAKLKGLVIASKYALAHKGILLPREKIHLRQLGFGAEKMVEVVFAVGQMVAANFVNVHLISEDVPVEQFLQEAGAFRNTVYKNNKEL